MDRNETNMRRKTWNPFSSASPYQPSAHTQNESLTAAPSLATSTTQAAGNQATTSLPLHQQSNLPIQSISAQATIGLNPSNESPSQPRDATLAQDTRPLIYEQDTPFGLGFSNSDPFIQDPNVAPRREIHLGGEKKPWWKRVGSKVSKYVEALNENLLYDTREGFPYPFHGKVKKWKEKRREKKREKKERKH